MDTLHRRKITHIVQILINSTQVTPPDAPQWCRIPFLQNLSLKILPLFPKEKVRIAFYTNKCCKTYLVRTRTRQSGLYVIECSDYDAIYVGQRGWSVSTGVVEHRACFIHLRHTFNFTSHPLDSRLLSNFTPNVLHRERKGPKLDALDELELFVCFIKSIPFLMTICIPHVPPSYTSLLKRPDPLSLQPLGLPLIHPHSHPLSQTSSRIFPSPILLLTTLI
jgi:hypothetical protein